MAEITQLGYQGIRDYIEANWNFIELKDNLGAPIVRLSTADPRVTWTHSAGAQTLELSIVVTGSDAEVTLPKTFAGSAIYTSAEATEAVTATESFSPFEMTMAEDQITVRHRIEVPQV
ncbi:hypothetical protein U1P98_07530 [Lysinibacillus irui]|uniref:Uncharacterized protein n=1 Tax=Lysinibacillus irui TaxID=2998077 RepID=A0ABU5NJD9_9BACI|nr:hypothetical protein [Lysinibacillus irui]MEA0553766.1 hypothetical protein [Lysinibacillus irui]MEA0976150.1 hypothetical protein [Lysinibacillus irui]MEA1042304.1 hypothetical protein [Lysinibacillus irui]